MDKTLMDEISQSFEENPISGQAEVAADALGLGLEENQVKTEVVADAKAVQEDPANVSNEDSTGDAAPADKPEESTEEAPSQPQSFDWNTFADKSGGLIKDEDTFASVVDKAKQYDDILKAKTELETNQFKPANEFVEKLNSLVAEGASKDQLNKFIQVSLVGDLKEMDPIEAKVAKMVLVDGFSEAVARKKVNRDFPLSDFEDGDDDKLILEDELRVSAKKDLEALQEYKKELSAFENPAKQDAERQRLEQIAKEEQYHKTLEVEVPKITQLVPKKFDFKHKVGSEEFEYSMEIDSKYPLNDAIKSYFQETKEPVNKESVQRAFEYVYADYVASNLPKVLEDYGAKLSSQLEEKFSNKYENRSGLPKPDVQSSADQGNLVQATEDFYAKMVGG